MARNIIELSVTIEQTSVCMFTHNNNHRAKAATDLPVFINTGLFKGTDHNPGILA